MSELRMEGLGPGIVADVAGKGENVVTAIRIFRDHRWDQHSHAQLAGSRRCSRHDQTLLSSHHGIDIGTHSPRHCSQMDYISAGHDRQLLKPLIRVQVQALAHPEATARRQAVQHQGGWYDTRNITT